MLAGVLVECPGAGNSFVHFGTNKWLSHYNKRGESLIPCWRKQCPGATVKKHLITGRWWVIGCNNCFSFTALLLFSLISLLDVEHISQRGAGVAVLVYVCGTLTGFKNIRLLYGTPCDSLGEATHVWLTHGIEESFCASIVQARKMSWFTNTLTLVPCLDKMKRL